MNNQTTNTRRRHDILFIAVLLFLCAAAAVTMVLTRAPGDTVTVTVDGEVFGQYPLDEDRTVEIRTENGYNLLVIEGGSAHVAEASCPDGICAAHKPISHGGESIICLPNKVVVEIRKTDSAQPDIVQ